MLKESVEKILNLKSQMNSNRLSVDPTLIPDLPFNPNWFIGFVEGDGSFFISGAWSTIVFSISQNTKSKKIIEQISQFVLNLPFKLPSNVEVSSKNIELAKSKLIAFKEQNKSFIYPLIKNDAFTFSIQNRYFIFFKLLPFFESYTFYTRKFTHFQMWSIILKLKMASFHLIPEGKEIIEKIAQSMNNGSYSNNQIKQIMPDIDKINKLFLLLNGTASSRQPKIFSILDNTGYKLEPFVLSVIPDINLEFEKKGYWVYDKGNLVEGSPFPSLRKAAIAIGHLNSSKSFKVDIEGEKGLFKKRYSFYSAEKPACAKG